MATHNEVVHAWANQTGRKHKGGSVSYEGSLLFSYFTCVANRIDPDFYLFSVKTYSNATRRHLSLAYRAAGYYRTMVTVDNVRPLGMEDHLANLNGIAARVQDEIARAKRSRLYKESILQRAQDMCDNGNAYAAYAARVAPGDYPRLTLGSDFEAVIASAAEVIRAQREATEAATIARQAEHRTAWLAGEAIHARLAGHPLLRLASGRTGIVETSWGVMFPLSQAKRIAVLARECLQTDTGYQPSETVKIGDFTLTRIEADGTIVAGCHVIPMEETHRFATSIFFWNDKMEVTSNQPHGV